MRGASSLALWWPHVMNRPVLFCWVGVTFPSPQQCLPSFDAGWRLEDRACHTTSSRSVGTPNGSGGRITFPPPAITVLLLLRGALILHLFQCSCSLGNGRGVHASHAPHQGEGWRQKTFVWIFLLHQNSCTEMAKLNGAFYMQFFEMITFCFN